MPKSGLKRRFSAFASNSLALPLLVSIITILQILFYVTFMTPNADPILPFDFAKKLIVIGSMMVIFMVIHRLRDDRINYYLMILGLLLVYSGQIENLIELYVNVEYFGTPFELKDLSFIGLLLLLVGLFRNTQKQIEARQIIAQQKRETELFADLLKHDLSNDLHVLMGYIESISLIEGELPPLGKDLLSSARVAGERMKNLINAFSGIGNVTDYDIVTLLEMVTKDAERANRGLKVEIAASSDVGNLKISGGNLLPCAFENLLRNSHEHAGSDAIVKIEIRKHNENAEIIFSDDGPGIPPKKINGLFSREKDESGSGVGLYLTHAIVTACGGTIELLESHQGAAFRILLPLAS